MEPVKELRERADRRMLYSMAHARRVHTHPRLAGFLLANCWIMQLEAKEAEEADGGTRERAS